jgi:dienelactone hydrolase
MSIFRVVSMAFATAIAVLLAEPTQAAMRTQYVDYTHGNARLKGYLAYDDAITGRRPAVLLLHNRAGMQENAIRDTEMIAKMGYVVFAADIFGSGIVPKTVPEMTAQTTIYNNDRALMRARARAGFDVLARHAMVDPAKIAVIGYCFGGTVAVELAESGAPAVGHIAVHGSFRNHTSADAKNIRGRFLILHGAEDDVAPMDEVNKLIADFRAAKVDWKMELYSGAEHGFTNPQNVAEERADREYKIAIERFFKEVFGG